MARCSDETIRPRILLLTSGLARLRKASLHSSVMLRWKGSSEECFTAGEIRFRTQVGICSAPSGEGPMLQIKSAALSLEKPNVFTRVLVAIPIGAIAINLLSWLVYGFDLPTADDWVEYYTGEATSFSLSHLFEKGNDTVYPIGRALDAVAQLTLHGNAVAYQFISMLCVLGFFLIIQWRLLSSAVNNRTVLACAFCLTVFMIGPGTYWGAQNNAYIQAIPFMGLMATIYIFANIFEQTRAPSKLELTTIFLIGTLTGLSYISGPLIETAVAIVFLVGIYFRRGPERLRGLNAGIALLAPSIITAAIQVAVIVVLQKGGLHRPEEHWALPTHWDYWFFMFGKIGRSLSLQSANPSITLVVVIALVSVAGAIFLIYADHAYHDRLDTPGERRFAFIFCSLVAANFLYLNEVSAGRANGYRPPNWNTPLGVLQFGFVNRFHFFPPTLFWPWLLAAVGLWLSKRGWLPARAFIAATLAIIGLAWMGGIFDNASDYRAMAAEKEKQFECLLSSRLDGPSIQCPSVFPTDLSPAIRYAMSIHASFTKYLPLLPITIGTNQPAPLFRLSASPATALTPDRSKFLGPSANGFAFAATDVEPQVVFSTGKAEDLRQCHHLQVAVLFRAERPDWAQLLFEAIGTPYFTSNNRDPRQYVIGSDGFSSVDFDVRSDSGFLDQIRFDPAVTHQNFTIKEIEARCRPF
jgi:hypothetical protein